MEGDGDGRRSENEAPSQRRARLLERVFLEWRWGWPLQFVMLHCNGRGGELCVRLLCEREREREKAELGFVGCLLVDWIEML